MQLVSTATIIPMILGFGCVTMAIVVTRLLGSERERRIAIFLLGLTIPCLGPIGVIAGMLSALGAKFLLVYVLVIFTVLAVTGTLLNSILPGKSSDLLIDLPPLRIPRADNVLKKTAVKSYAFLLEAAPLFIMGALIIGDCKLLSSYSPSKRDLSADGRVAGAS